MSNDSRIQIIAEVGVNHNGDMDMAHKLIDKSIEAGADIVKFQTFIADKIATEDAVKANYQLQNSDASENQRGMLKKLQLSKDQHYELISHCKKCNIEFLSTAFDIDSLRFLKKLGLNLFKVPSGELTNLPYLREIASYKKELIVSTGMANLSEIESAINAIESSGLPRQKIVVLHCTTSYPTNIYDVNLNAMKTISNAFKVEMGYSDHTKDIEIAIAASAIGAKVIEKNLTLNKNLSGPDHKASLEPNEFRKMVKYIRNVEIALGDGIKKPVQSELLNINNARKSIVAKKFIKEGDIFCENNITTKRPGNGLSPMIWDELIGKEASRNYDEDEFIEL